MQHSRGHGKLLDMTGDLVTLLKAALPEAQQRRTERVLVALTLRERTSLEVLAKERGEAVATTARNLIKAALEVLEPRAQATVMPAPRTRARK